MRTSAILLAAVAMLAIQPADVFAQQREPTAQPTEAVNVAAAARPAPPKLLIVIAIDQFSADLFAQYRGEFTGGLARLSGGIVFPQGYQAHAATETCPGHSTILTGSHPARTGIVANNWYDLTLARDDRRVYCSEDPTVAGTSSASGRYAPSPNFLLVPTLGAVMQSADPRTRVVSIAGKDRAAIMMGGRTANEMWWLAPTGLASFRDATVTEHVARMSTAVAGAINSARPPLELPTACASRDRPVEIGGGQTVGTGRLGRDAGNFRGFLASPEADAAVLAVGAGMMAVHRLGQGPQTDLLILGLSATDYVGHTYGTEGTEMCLQLLTLDRELGEFFDRVDASGVDYAVALTADHGGHDLPERNDENAAPSAERVDVAVAAQVLGPRLKAQLGITLDGPLLYADGPFGDYYVDPRLSPTDRDRVMRAAVDFLRGHRQVEMVMLGSDVAAMPLPTRSPELWTVPERLRASYLAGRSGDFLVVLKPRVTPIPNTSLGYVATHGSAWDYDRRVPILFWQRGLAPFEQPNPVMTVDIMPTLAALVGVAIDPRTIDGRCLDLIAGPASSCPGQ